MLGKATMLQLEWVLDRPAGSLSTQLADQIRRSVQSGQLKAGDQIPATRRLANDLSVARGTVTTAIELLVAEGLLEARTGAGTFVSAAAMCIYQGLSERVSIRLPETVALPAADIDPLVQASIDLRPCRPSMEAFPLAAWRRSMSLAAAAYPSPDYGDPQGDEGLRIEISDYLRRARGLLATPEQIIITNGSVHAMHILSSLYLNPKTKVVFENPGFPLARQTFTLSGASIHDCAIDQDGLVLDTLPQADGSVRLVYVTPSHQFPTGSRLALGRRHELISWAAKNGALIIEDDYDGEFRYDVPPLPPMATMAPDVVVYCGTFSKTLFPGLRIGFAVAARPVIAAMARYRTLTEYAPNLHTQLTLRHFIANGQFERHVHRMRRLYAAKRNMVAETLNDCRIDAQLSGLESGLSALIEIDAAIPATTVSRQAAAHGILIPALSRYTYGNKPQRNALVAGYAAATPENINIGLIKALAG